MVLTTTIRQMATKRVPLIKFRRQREDEAATLRTGSMGTGDLKPKSSSPAAAISLPTIEDWQLPEQYRRKQLDSAEIEYINRGGPD